MMRRIIALNFAKYFLAVFFIFVFFSSRYVVAAPAIPPTAHVEPIANEDTLSTAVGTIDGEFRVTESGEASYRIPILTPVGVGGISPTLALAYSSQGGNGPVGLGWRVDGLSAITRCRQTMEQDGQDVGLMLDATDRFCLDGQRLVSVNGTYGANGTEYRTEIDSMTKVVSYGTLGNGPAYFRVWRQDGSFSDYGNSVDAALRVNDEGTQLGTVLSWAQRFVVDNVGNRVDFKYLTDHAIGEQLISEVKYSPNISIRFHYTSNRTDRATRYVSGSKVELGELLSHIRTYDNGVEVRELSLSYQTRNRQYQLNRVIESAQGISKPATLFAWSSPSHGYSQGSRRSLARDFQGGRPADTNGDGKQDLIYIERDGSRGYLRVYLSNGSYFTNSCSNRVLFDSDKDSEDEAWYPLDYNSDGRTDVIFAQNGFWRVHLANVNGCLSSAGTNLSIPTNGNAEKALLLDVNSDGLADLVRQSGRNRLDVHYLQLTGNAYSPYAFNSVAESLSIPLLEEVDVDGSEVTTVTRVADLENFGVGDFDGDGRADLLVTVTETEEFYDGYTGESNVDTSRYTQAFVMRDDGQYELFDSLSSLPNSQEDIQVVDINGDSLADILYRRGNTWYSSLNTGRRFLFGQSINAGQSDKDIFLADYNLDGLPDIHYEVSEDYLYVALNTGNGFLAGFNTGIETDRQDEGYVNLFTDVNGDGYSDHVFFKNNRDWQQVSLHRGSFIPANAVTNITDGFGNVTAIEYDVLTDSSLPHLYNRGTDAYMLDYGHGSPVFDMHPSIFVVSQVASSSPSYSENSGVAGGYQHSGANQVKISYRYEGARIQSGGRGFLGFEKLTTLDQQTQIRSETTYRQDYPYTGMPLKTESYDHLGNLLHRAENTYGELSLKSGASIYPHLSQSSEHHYTVNSDGSREQVSTVITHNTYSVNADNHANLTRVSIETLDGSGIQVNKVTTDNTYIDDVSQWWLSRVTETRATHQRPGKATIIRQTDYGYYPIGHPNAGMLKEEITEPNDTDNLYLRKLHCYDNKGNMTGSAVHSRHFNPQQCTQTYNTIDDPEKVYRRKLYNYDGQGRYLVEERDDKFVKQTVVSRNELGLVTTAEDINNVTDEIRYDAFGMQYFERDSTGSYTIVSRRFARDSAQIGAPSSFYPYTYVERIESAGTSLSFNYYDSLGRQVAAINQGFDGRYIYNYMHYDSLGRSIASANPHYAGQPIVWNRTYYDKFGRITQTRDPSGTTINLSYDGLFTTYLTQSQYNGYAVNQSRYELKNALGETLATQDSMGGTVTHEYNAAGNPTRFIGVDNAVIVNEFDKLGRKLTSQDPDKGVWHYQYNAIGEMTQQTSAKGHVTRYYRDTLGRDTKRTVVGAGSHQTSLFNYGTSHLMLSESIVGGISKSYVYDALGRISSITSYIEGQSFTERTTYDQYGRLFQVFDASGEDRGLLYEYQNGYLLRQREAQDGLGGKIYYQAEAMDARDNVTQFSRSNGTVTQAAFNHDTGYKESVQVSNGYGVVMQKSFVFDGLGNLRQRQNHTLKAGSQYQVEDFGYDDLNRLTHVNGQQQVRYQANGNIDWKHDVDNGQAAYYCYSSSRPHAVTGLGSHSGCSSNAYQYDNNGNMISGRGRTITYDHNDKLTNIVPEGAGQTLFSYDTDGKRYKRVEHIDGLVQTKIQIGNVEVISNSGSTEVQYRRTLGDVMHAVWRDSVNASNNRENTRYLHKDHLGSVDTITNGRAKVVQKLYYNPWGKKQQIHYSDWTIFPNRFLVACGAGAQPCLVEERYITSRGFTGHEHIEQSDLIHMNGRIYDPTLGRFIQADPNIQAATNSQSYNRYAYVLNNPLSYTDPSGFFFNKIFKGLNKLLGKFAPFVGIALLAIPGVGAWAAQAWYNAAAVGFVSGGIATGSLKGALVGAFSAAAFQQIGQAFRAKSGFLRQGGAGHIGAHAATGGVTSVLNGGKFGHGFLSAGLVKSFNINEILPGVEAGKNTARIIGAAIIGGTISQITGGKFANGAATAGFGQAVNGNSFWERAKDFGEFALEFLPGYDLVNCVTGSCNYLEWSLAVGEVALAVAGGGAVTALYKVYKAASKVERAASFVRQGRKFWTKSRNFNGNKVFQRDDLIDPKLVDARGRSNLERMHKGLAPIGPDGKSINLHHMTQRNNGSIAELTQTFHQQNSKVIHINPNSIPSGINRGAFNRWRSDYWQSRASDFN